MVRVGLAGYGMAGRDIHAPLIRDAGLEIVAVSTSNPERRAAVGEDFPDAVVVDDLGALLEVDGLDLVVLATPTGDHSEHVKAVIDAAVPCVVDKPIALDASAALELVDAAEHAGVPLTVFQNRRWDPAHLTLASVVSNQLVGETFRCELRYERWRPVPKDRWRENLPATEGGGLLLDLHAHLIDAAVHLFGRVDSVFATVDARTTTSEDDAFLVCRHESGMVSHLGALSIAGAPGPRTRLLGLGGAYLQNEVAGELNVFPELADADPEHCGWLYRGEEREAVPRTPGDQVDFYRAVGEALGAGDASAVQAAMPVDPRDAVHTMAVIDAARVSAEGNRVVEVLTPGERP